MISGHPPLHFDLSTFDIYGTVAAGAQLHLIPPELSVLPHRLAGFIRDSELTQWFSVPSILNHLAKFDVIQWDDFPALRRLLWCGEKFPAPALIHWMHRLPHVDFFNLYGPTETTIASSCYRVPRCPESATAEIPIGEPCQGERLLVLNERMRPVKPGETGDLYIAGVGLSPGYWRDPEKTSEVFLADPEGSDNRIYRTGDLAKIGDDGYIYLLGRSDSQIKSRGCRIELGEIESAVHCAPGVQEAAIVAIDSPGLEGTAICCAYVACPDSGASTQSLKKHLAEHLPSYMVPTHWMALERMPRNGNGKIDRPGLKEQFQQLADGAARPEQGAKEVANVA
jgi:non-ribosomal peptide synthetase component F